MRKILITLLVILELPLFSEDTGNYLLCIHGFMGAPWNMSFLEKNLCKDGWDIINWHYCSRDNFITEHGKQLVEKLILLAQEKPTKPIHFVAHSMGSLVLLSALNDPRCPIEAKTGKVVLIAPPLHGSTWGRWLSQFSAIQWLLKDFSGRELMTKTDFKDLGTYPDSLQGILVIAGNFGFNPLLSKDNDGTISVEETLLQIPHEHIVMRAGHKTLLFSKKACHATREFIKRETTDQ